ncbi:MAG TPA: hypothetical protein H9902_14720 [Candidatus Stackebrandtia faecavium]|nr:hypothetical protein [Candidatus Stackebrandtia faecavium]
MQLTRIFALIGVVFGAVFVFANASGLPETLAWPVRILGALLAVSAVWFGIIRRPTEAGDPPEPSSVRTYWIAVAAQFVAIPAGAAVLNAFDLSALVLPWVVFVVGAHFLPAKAFGVGRWWQLGISLVMLGVVGALGAALISPMFAPICGVGAGYILLAFVSVPRWSSA